MRTNRPYSTQFSQFSAASYVSVEKHLLESGMGDYPDELGERFDSLDDAVEEALRVLPESFGSNRQAGIPSARVTRRFVEEWLYPVFA